MRKTFTLTQEQYDALIAQMQAVPYMIIGGQAPRSQQDNANAAWQALGRELGFDGMTVRPGSHKLEFTADAVEK